MVIAVTSNASGWSVALIAALPLLPPHTVRISVPVPCPVPSSTTWYVTIVILSAPAGVPTPSIFPELPDVRSLIDIGSDPVTIVSLALDPVTLPVTMQTTPLAHCPQELEEFTNNKSPMLQTVFT